MNLPETQPGKVSPHQRASSCRFPAGPLLRSAQQATGFLHHLQQAVSKAEIITNKHNYIQPLIVIHMCFIQY